MHAAWFWGCLHMVLLLLYLATLNYVLWKYLEMKA